MALYRCESWSLFDFFEAPGYIRNMNPLDIVFLGILGVSLLYSTWKGFVRDVFSLVGILGGFLLAARYYPFVATWLRPWLKTEWVAALVACGVLFLAAYVGVSLVGRMLGRSLRLLKLGWLDRTVGFGFGLLKGLVLCLGLFVALVNILPSKTAVLQESRLAPVLVELVKDLGEKLPGQAGKWLQELTRPGGKREGWKQAQSNGKQT